MVLNFFRKPALISKSRINHNITNIIDSEYVPSTSSFPIVKFNQAKGFDGTILGNKSKELNSTSRIVSNVRQYSLVRTVYEFDERPNLSFGFF